MSTTPKPKFAQELAKRIVNTKGVLPTERPAIRRQMTMLATSDDPVPLGSAATRRIVLLALQVAARDEQVWTGLVAARAALGKR